MLRHEPHRDRAALERTQTPMDDVFFGKSSVPCPGKFCVAVRKVRARLRNPLYSVEDYLTILTRQGVVVTVSDLEQFAKLL